MTEEILTNRDREGAGNEDENIEQIEEPAEIIEEGGPVHATLTISKRRSKSRIDKYLQNRFPRFSRTTIQKLIREGAITVNSQATKSSYEILPGDTINLILPPIEESKIIPEDIPLEIIYEDQYLVAVNKPPNMVTHPARGYQSGTLVHAMKFHCEKLSTCDDPIRPGIVHRLDKDTTGVIVVAKDDEAHWRLALQFERRKIHKEYLAVVEGTLDLDSDRIDAPIGSHPTVRERYSVRKEIGRQASTVYQVIERFKGFTFVRLLPETGRTHQLRVHMSYLKHPIVSDTMYGGRKLTLGHLNHSDDPTIVMPRFALHAHVLEFRHPITGKEIKLQAPIPEDFQNLLVLLRRR